MNTLLNYPGAKWGMAREIVALMPPHRSYLEPFFGSGAVLFNKPPSAIETVNDVDGDVVNFFKVLREQPEKLAAYIAMTPYSRAVFDDAHENRGSSDFERAWKFAIRSKMGHGFANCRNCGFKINVTGSESAYLVRYWNQMPQQIIDAAERLKSVQIENRPALELIRKFNHDNVLIYADPPYLLNTRGGKQYRYEMTEQDHVELLEKQSESAEDICGRQFVQACMTAARYLVQQGEKIVDLEQELATAKSEREYFRSRAAFFGEVAGVSDKIISVEGYKAFRGTMKIRPKTAAVPSFELSGDWLYKPETGCWYGKGSSFPEDICTIAEVGTKKLIEWKIDLICGGFAEEWAYVCPECGCKISDKSGLGLGEYARSNQRLNLCPNCGSITKKGTNI